MEVIGLLGTIVVIGGATFLFLRLINASDSKKNRQKRAQVSGSGLGFIDDGGAHLDVSNTYDTAGDSGCD